MFLEMFSLNLKIISIAVPMINSDSSFSVDVRLVFGGKHGFFHRNSLQGDGQALRLTPELLWALARGAGAEAKSKTSLVSAEPSRPPARRGEVSVTAPLDRASGHHQMPAQPFLPPSPGCVAVLLKCLHWVPRDSWTERGLQSPTQPAPRPLSWASSGVSSPCSRPPGPAPRSSRVVPGFVLSPHLFPGLIPALQSPARLQCLWDVCKPSSQR